MPRRVFLISNICESLKDLPELNYDSTCCYPEPLTAYFLEQWQKEKESVPMQQFTQRQEHANISERAPLFIGRWKV